MTFRMSTRSNHDVRIAFPALQVLLIPLLFTAIASSRADAASTSMDIAVVGTVVDTAGAPLSNVQVVVSGLNRAALSDDKGRFIIRGIPPGTYHLDLVRIGYSSEHVVVNVPATGDNVHVRVTMRVAMFITWASLRNVTSVSSSLPRFST